MTPAEIAFHVCLWIAGIAAFITMWKRRKS